MVGVVSLCVNVGTQAVYWWYPCTTCTHVTQAAALNTNIEEDLIVLSQSVMRSHTQQEMPQPKLALLFNISKACGWLVAGLHKNHPALHPA